MKIYHTETQEDYDALMVELSVKCKLKLKSMYWSVFKSRTVVFLNENNRLSFGSVMEAKEKYPNVFIQKYKTNQNDPVNNPKHYTQGELEVIDILQDKLTPQEFEGFLKGNILKYTFREGIKNGTEDVKKGAWYAAKLIEFRENKGD